MKEAFNIGEIRTLKTLQGFWNFKGLYTDGI